MSRGKSFKGHRYRVHRYKGHRYRERFLDDAVKGTNG
jgi:hypothetical protein